MADNGQRARCRVARSALLPAVGSRDTCPAVQRIGWIATSAAIASYDALRVACVVWPHLCIAAHRSVGEELGVNLAISLHAPNDALRDVLVRQHMRSKHDKHCERDAWY